MAEMADPSCLSGVRLFALLSHYSVAGPWRRVVVLPHATRHTPHAMARRLSQVAGGIHRHEKDYINFSMLFPCMCLSLF
jgi:hypothetical protein